MKFSSLKLAASALFLMAATLPAHAQQSASDSATATAKIIRPIAVTKDQDMTFGTLVRGSGTVTVSNTGSRSVTGDVQQLASTSASNAQFTVAGEGGQSIAVTVPATVTMTNTTGSGAETLTITTTNDMSGSAGAQTLSNALGTDGDLVVKIGGSFPLTTATATGVYSGSFTVSANYN